jgi:hypothetical protein
MPIHFRREPIDPDGLIVHVQINDDMVFEIEVPHPEGLTEEELEIFCEGVAAGVAGLMNWVVEHNGER